MRIDVSVGQFSAQFMSDDRVMTSYSGSSYQV